MTLLLKMWSFDMILSKMNLPSPIFLLFPLLCGLSSGQIWGAFELLVSPSISCLVRLELLVCSDRACGAINGVDPIWGIFPDLLLVANSAAGVLGSGGLELLWGLVLLSCLKVLLSCSFRGQSRGAIVMLLGYCCCFVNAVAILFFVGTVVGAIVILLGY
ncbi:hypothetical protein ACOSQ3_003630 [Xanthoceras sorbifolium]